MLFDEISHSTLDGVIIWEDILGQSQFDGFQNFMTTQLVPLPPRPLARSPWAGGRIVGRLLPSAASAPITTEFAPADAALVDASPAYALHEDTHADFTPAVDGR